MTHKMGEPTGEKVELEGGRYETRSSLNALFKGQDADVAGISLSCMCECHAGEPQRELLVLYDRELQALVITCPTCLDSSAPMAIICVGEDTH